MLMILIGWGLFNFAKHCIYIPAKANSLYKQGYALIEQNEFPQSKVKFDSAVRYRLSKNWFFKYARAYREKKQYQRSAQMYTNILRCFNNDKTAGLEYAQMELDDLANYERAEEILRREVLDYHVNDPDGILMLGDVFLEWGTEKDASKFDLAQEQYSSLLQLYKPNNLFSDGLIIKEFIPLVVGIISSEIIRSIVLAQENKITSVITFIAFLVVDLILMTNIYSIKTFYGFMDLIGLVLLPSLMSNILYHNVSKEYGLFPNIALKAIVSLYMYIIPFVPSTPEPLISLVGLIFPLLMLGLINMLYQKKPKVALEKTSKLAPVILGIVIVFSSMFGLLVSNQFHYGALVIATDSMTGEINKGDFVVFEKIEPQDTIEVGNIVVFEKNDSYIVHRIVEIEKVNNQIQYYTKGDANQNNDEGFITKSDIVGVTKFKISYLGYPTLWLRDIFE